MIEELIKAYIYNPYQWAFFFMFYCFVGWCWEVFYVSLFVNKPPEFVNRGFMKGPFLPIYGCGAMCIIVLTLPFKPYPLAVFILGVIGPTLLELATGMLMEVLFKVRYWDYSRNFCNYKGHICLKSSIFWGLISLVLMYVGHPYVEGFVLEIPSRVLNPLVIILGIGMIVDFSTSFQTALDLIEMLEAFEKQKEEFIRDIAELNTRRHRAIVRLIKRNPAVFSIKYADSLTRYKEIFLFNIEQTIEAGKQKMLEEKEEAIELIEKVKDESVEKIDKLIEEGNEVIERISKK